MRKRRNQEKRKRKNHKSLLIIKFSGMKTKSIFSVFLFFLVGLVFFSCDRNKVYESNTEIPGGIWNNNYSAEFIVDITDTESQHNVYVNIRNKSDYSYSNLFLFINSKAPDGAMIRDTVEYILADKRGKWLGSGLGSVWFNQLPFKTNVKFPLKGQYTFHIEQAMRVKELNSIVDIGIRVEKQKD